MLRLALLLTALSLVACTPGSATPWMRYYYAFNSRRYCHAVAPGVPQAIVEAGFLTSAADRQLLIGNPDLAARGIVNGIIAFLRSPLPS